MIDHVELILTLVSALQDCTLVGSPAPRVRDIYEYMRAKPQPGDLVVETSTAYKNPKDPARIGVLLRTEDRLVCRHERDDVNLERCEECPEDERCMDHFTWVHCLSDENRRHRWHNAGFVRVPRDWGTYRRELKW